MRQQRGSRKPGSIVSNILWKLTPCKPGWQSEYPKDNGSALWARFNWKKVFVCRKCDTTARRAPEGAESPKCPGCQITMEELPWKAQIRKKGSKNRFDKPGMAYV